MHKYEIIQYKHNLSANQITNLDFIYEEVGKRMLHKLDYIKLIPKTVLDLGNGTAISPDLLKSRYPKASLYQLSFALGILKTHFPEQNLLQKFLSSKPYIPVCTDIAYLPLANQSIDMLWSNLILPYIDDFEQYFKEIRRVLTLGGFFLVSGFGVDSLHQLRDIGLRTYNFPDMHVIGDILVRLGFTNPVTDVEYITIEYDDFKQLLQDIRIIGCGSGINNKSNLRRSDYCALESKFNKLTKNGKIPLTLEVFYAHAWKDKISLDLESDRKIVQFYPQTK